MRIFLAVLAVVLAIPPLLVVAIALGPVALLAAWAILCLAPFALVGWAGVKISNRRWKHTTL